MRFTDLRKELNDNLAEVNSAQDYLAVYLTSTIQNKLEELNNHYVEHLLKDLSNCTDDLDIQGFLGKTYMTANEFAKECVHTVFRSADLHGFKVSSWTSNALKCFDNFILVLIQEVLKEEVKPNNNVGLEREKYWHLIDKGSDTPFYKIGMGLDVIYGCRNEFEHIEIVEKSGQRKQKPLSKKRIREKKELIINSFEESLTRLVEFLN